MTKGSSVLDEWVRSYAAELAPEATRGSRVRWLEAPSGARLGFVGDVVAKLHHPRTSEADLTSRVAALDDSRVASLFVPPLDRRVHQAPDGCLVTWWPKVQVLTPDSAPIPWAAAGGLLARLHDVDHNIGLPRHGGLDRLRRAAERATTVELRHRDLLAPLAARLLREVAEATQQREPAQRHTRMSLCHGDFHLGQLGHHDGAWRLLDVDDLGVGDPWWDLGRPAGFWAVGLLDDESWNTFMGAYGVTGDVWPSLDLPARAAVVIAAVREPDEALLESCRRM